MLKRLFGAGRRREADAGGEPKLSGLDPTAQRAVELQKAYWRFDADEYDALWARGVTELSWKECFRLHHLGVLRRVEEVGLSRLVEGTALPEATAAELEMLAHLCSKASPYRPRHGFCWQGQRPPETDEIPYSDFQGRLMNACTTHLGAFEVLSLDDALTPQRVEFLAFDEVMTLASPAGPPFRGARILPEYGHAPRVVLLPRNYGLTWRVPVAELLRGEQHRVLGSPRGEGDEPLAGAGVVGLGAQTLRCASEFADEGLSELSMSSCYQISLAIDADDPRFEEKCRGRGIDPAATRAEAEGERKRKSGRVRLKTL